MVDNTSSDSEEDNDKHWLETEADNILGQVEAATSNCREPLPDDEGIDDRGVLPQYAVAVLNSFTVEQHLEFVAEVFRNGDCNHRWLMLNVLFGGDMEVRIRINIEKAKGLLEKAAQQLMQTRVAKIVEDVLKDADSGSAAVDEDHYVDAVDGILKDVECHGYLQPGANLQLLANAQRCLAWFARQHLATAQDPEYWCPDHARRKQVMEAAKEASNGLRDVVMLEIVQQQTDRRNVAEFDSLAAKAYSLSNQQYFDEERHKLHLAYHKDAINNISGFTSTNAKVNQSRSHPRGPRKPRDKCQSSEPLPAFVFARRPLPTPGHVRRNTKVGKIGTIRG